jgi:hypothetical protein
MVHNKPTRDEDTGNYPSYAWPGGYPLFYIIDTYAVCCPDCLNDKGNEIPDSKVSAVDINYEDTSLYCEWCNKQIPSAYGEDGDEAAETAE